LMVQLWYPAQTAHVAETAPYVEAGAARVLDQELRVPPGTFEAVRVQAHVGESVASASGPLPVILYSPGFGSWRNASTSLVEELVSRGWFVVTIDHPYDAEAVEFPNGTIDRMRTVPQQNTQSTNPLAQWDTSVEQRLLIRVADVRFVLGVLATLNAGGNPDAEGRRLPRRLAGALDLSRIALFGHSLGAATTIEVMRQDRRLRAALMLDGPVPSAARATDFDRPIMLVRSDNAAIGELIVPSWQSFALGLRGWQRVVLISGANHNDFTDLGLVARHDRFSSSLRKALLLGTIDARTAVALERSYLTMFFDRFNRRSS
jgi:predicted dienelactone hydrolase